MVKRTSVIICIFLLLLTGCGNSNRVNSKKLVFVPKIQYDTATLSGKITGKTPLNERFRSIELKLNKVVTGDWTIYKIPVKEDGTFIFSIPVQCISFAPLAIEKSNVITCLIPREETKMELNYNGEQVKPIKISNSIGFTAEDAMIINSWPWGLPNIGNEVISPELFSQRIIEGIPELLKPVENNPELSKSAKQMLTAEIKLACIYHGLFNYTQYIKRAYENQPKTDSLQKEFHFQVPGKSYYSFLRHFNLNDPSYLTAGFYPLIIQSLLNNDTLAIPAIKEMPINMWLNKVKEILKDDIGNETGLFYDLLVSNAFTKQINDKTPLSDVQIQNIESYFTNKSFVHILSSRNNEVIKLQVGSRARKFNVSSTGNVMDSIISKYKGKVIFVDFWATWCGPCQLAMKRSESVRKDFENKDVAFVYVTSPSSPRNVWEQQIPEIGGDHYYVTEKEYDYLNKIYGFDAIPHYLIFDKNGILKHNYHTFMGNENMKKWIEESF